MDPRMKQNSILKSGSDIPSPVLLRRRLSAPETVMRKYKLARTRSQENDTGPSHDPKFGDLSCNLHGGSEMNLQKKKDTTAMMRKSTLLRRLMNNPKTFGSSSFQEWQHYCGKLSTPSLNSLQGSPEHMSKSYSRRSLIGYEYKTSPKHALGSKKISPVHQPYETHKKNPDNSINMSPKRRIENHSYHLKSTKPKEPTISSSHTSSVSDHFHSKNDFDGHSDSAYCNDKSKFTSTPVSSCSKNSTNLTTQESMTYRNRYLRNNSDSMDQRNVDENRNFSVDTSMNYVTHETSTQTNSSTNLNVISNVKLSQKTLDLIVGEVMKDVQKNCTNGNNMEEKTGGSIHVQKICGIYSKPNGTIDRANKSSKSLTDVRFHDGGHDSSRISVTSSKSSVEDRSEKHEEQSEITSLADSLEETSSSRLSFKKYDEKPVRGDLPLISVNRRKLVHAKPPDVFFVPMKTDSAGYKPVSDYLPEKLKEKILRRQKDRRDKSDHYKETPNMCTENINKFLKSDSKSQPLKNKVRSRKHLLPSIESFRKGTKTLRTEYKEKISDTKKSNRKLKENLHTLKKTKSGSHHNEDYDNQHFHLYKSENDFMYEGGPKRIYHKAEFRNSNRRIEILEIMECVDLFENSNKMRTKTRSKIPVLRDPNLAKTPFNPFLTKEATHSQLNGVLRDNPSLEQLITDILIQSMNESTNVSTESKTSNNRNQVSVPKEDFSKCIPEQIVQESLNEIDNGISVSAMEKTNESEVQLYESSNDKNISETKQLIAIKTPIFDNNHNERTTATNSKDTQTIENDWVVFYPFQKKEGHKDKTSNEGRNLLNPKIEMKNRKLDGKEVFDLPDNEWRRSKQEEEKRGREDSNGKNDFHERIILSPPIPKRYSRSSRKSKYRNTPNENPTPGEWSITLSGMNNATIASDLEMKIRFPSSQRNNRYSFNGESSGRGKNNELYCEDYRFSKTNHDNFNNFDRKIYNENNRRLRNIPDFHNLRNPVNRRVSDPVAALRAMDITDIRPRQTKTSLKRYSLTRPKLHPLFESNVDNSDNDSYRMEKKFKE